MKKLLVHVGVLTPRQTGLRQHLYTRHSAAFEDPKVLWGSRFARLYEDRLVKLRGAVLAETFQEALYPPHHAVYRISSARFLDGPFSGKSFFPLAKRYARLVQHLKLQGVEVRTLVIIRNRLGLMLEDFKRQTQSKPVDFQSYANSVISSQFDWHRLAHTLKGIPTVFLPEEAIDRDPKVFARCINEFFESDLLHVRDVYTLTTPKTPRAQLVSLFDTLDDPGLREALQQALDGYLRRTTDKPILSAEIEGIYNAAFQEGDEAFAKAYFPSTLRHIYSVDPTPMEQFVLPFLQH